MDLKNNTDAQNAFKKVTEIDNQYAYAYYALAVICENSENKADALNYYKTFLQYNKDASIVAQVENRITSLEK